MSAMPITRWPLQERLREKLLRSGPVALSDSELLAIILRIGSNGVSTIEFSRRILVRFGRLRKMSDADMAEWRGIKRLDMTKTASPVAAVEIARRFWAEPSSPPTHVRTAADVASLVGPHLRDLKHEVLDLVLLNKRNRSLGAQRMNEGAVTETYTYPREVLSLALQKRAASIMLVHNHPSGCPTPSAADIVLTRSVVETGKVMGVTVPDHVIIAGETYFSFAESGQMRGTHQQDGTKE